jgi:hypothetical protein
LKASLGEEKTRGAVGGRSEIAVVRDNPGFGDWMREQSSSSGAKKNVWAVGKIASSGETPSGVLCDVMR